MGKLCGVTKGRFGCILIRLLARGSYWWWYSFTRAAITKCHRLGGRNVLSHSPGSWKCQMKVLAGQVPPKASLPGLQWPSAGCVFMLFLCESIPAVSLGVNLIFIEGQSQIELGPL